MSRRCGGGLRGPRHSAALILLALLLSGCAGSTAGPGAPEEPSRAGSGGRLSPSALQPVVVDLAVDWRPEGQLPAQQVREQRQRIQLAQDAVLSVLGRHGRLRRPLHETAQTALLVDDVGLVLLRADPRVAAVHLEQAAPAG